MSPDDFPVFPSPFYSGLVTHRLHATWDFYTERLGFHTVDEHDDWVRLLHPCGAQLVLIREESGMTPAELVNATNGRGFWLTLEVADAGRQGRELAAAGVPVAGMPAAACWPQDSFAVTDPNGVLVVIMSRAALATVAAPMTAAVA